MQIRTTYIGTLNGVSGIWCGFKPENAIITEERLVLYPETGHQLLNKLTKEIALAVWIKNTEQQNDWIEIPFPEPDLKETEDDDNN